MAFAMVFPGQGSQSVGMLGALLESQPAAAEAFAEAGDVLGYDLGRLVREGPAEDLNRTEVTQPAMLTAGVAVWRAWRANGGAAPAAMAGHSLGEYTALVCADALSFGDAVRLVRLRGQLMQQAVPEGAGAMAAILGLEDADVEAACAGVPGVVEAVNFNAPGQVVIAGDAVAVAAAVERAKAAGARRAVPLPVSVPSHCRLMTPAAQGLAEALGAIDIRSPDVPVFHNVDAATRSTPDDIRAALAEQVRRPVRWVGCVEAMRASGADLFVEAGPGRVLAGLVRRIDKSLAAQSADDPDTLRSALAATRGTEA